MTPETFLRMRALFDQAMALPAEERQTFLDREAPSGDPLRAQLQAMVEAGDDSAFLAEAARSGIPTDALPGRAADPGLQISNYRVLREIARGGMGVVYLAVRNDDVFHKIVALKVIAGNVAKDSDFVARFRQERQILAGLDHPNIARILDGGNTQDGLPFYVMEHVAGSAIDEYCTRNKTDVATRVRMMVEVCHAVDYLHAHAVTHRDIKPSNILVASDGRVKLVDFGIAKVDTVAGLVASPSAPGQPTMIMTPGYASPEQLHGVASGKSGDIYSLGVVLYQLLTGRLPFVDDSGRPNLTAQLSGEEPPPPSKERKSGTDRVAAPADSRRISDPDLDRVVLTAIQRDPARRYPSVKVFADDLQRCLEGRAITARLDPAYRFRRLVARNRLTAALAVLLVLMTGVGAWMAVSLRIERVRLEAKEDELGRFVALMDSRVERWQGPGIPVVEKVADIRAANDVMASDTVRTLSAKAPDPERVKQMIDELRTVMDRAERLSAGLVPLRKEIAIVYRQIGDFQATATRPQVADRTQAQATYKRAATVVASVRKDEPQWAAEQLSELGGRLKIMGVQFDVAAAEPDPGPEPPPPPAPAPETISVEAPRALAKPQPAPVPPAPAPSVDPAARAEVLQRLRSVSGNAEIAHRNLEALQNSLARSGQTVRGDLTTSMSRVDDLIEDAKTAVAADDLAGADECLNRAAYELRRLLQSVGG